MISCIIIDDEPIAHRVLRNHLEELSHVQVLASFHNAADAEAFLKTNHIDFIFLDVEMPEVRGIDFLKRLEVKPITVITTAFRDYAVDGFELGVLDYLLKPISRERLSNAVKRVTEMIQLMQVPSSINDDHTQKYEILIKAGTQKVIVDLRKITHAQGLKDYTILFTEDKKYLVKGSVKAMEKYLPDSHFIRVHRSFLIAKERVKVVNHNRIELGEISIPIGKLYKEVVSNFLVTRLPSKFEQSL